MTRGYLASILVLTMLVFAFGTMVAPALLVHIGNIATITLNLSIIYTFRYGLAHICRNKEEQDAASILGFGITLLSVGMIVRQSAYYLTGNLVISSDLSSDIVTDWSFHVWTFGMWLMIAGMAVCLGALNTSK